PTYKSSTGFNALQAVCLFKSYPEILSVLVDALRRSENSSWILGRGLWCAVAFGTAADVKLLVDAGANPNAYWSLEGKSITAFDLARKRGKQKRALLEQAAANWAKN